MPESNQTVALVVTKCNRPFVECHRSIRLLMIQPKNQAYMKICARNVTT